MLRFWANLGPSLLPASSLTNKGFLNVTSSSRDRVQRNGSKAL